MRLIALCVLAVCIVDHGFAGPEASNSEAALSDPARDLGNQIRPYFPGHICTEKSTKASCASSFTRRYSAPLDTETDCQWSRRDDEQTVTVEMLEVQKNHQWCARVLPSMLGSLIECLQPRLRTTYSCTKAAPSCPAMEVEQLGGARGEEEKETFTQAKEQETA